MMKNSKMLKETEDEKMREEKKNIKLNYTKQGKREKCNINVNQQKI